MPLEVVADEPVAPAVVGKGIGNHVGLPHMRRPPRAEKRYGFPARDGLMCVVMLSWYGLGEKEKTPRA